MSLSLVNSTLPPTHIDGPHEDFCPFKKRGFQGVHVDLGGGWVHHAHVISWILSHCSQDVFWTLRGSALDGRPCLPDEAVAHGSGTQVFGVARDCWLGLRVIGLMMK